jgi:hypothetical protein
MVDFIFIGSSSDFLRKYWPKGARLESLFHTYPAPGDLSSPSGIFPILQLRPVNQKARSISAPRLDIVGNQ